jgi:hypothetical protein
LPFHGSQISNRGIVAIIIVVAAKKQTEKDAYDDNYSKPILFHTTSTIISTTSQYPGQSENKKIPGQALIS